MRFLLYPFFLIIFSTALSAQDPAKSDLTPCASPVGIDPWLLEFQRHAPTASARSEDTLYMALQVHLLSRDDGSGRFPPTLVLNALCQLNTDFSASGIQFFLKDNWHNINSTAWWKHSTVPQGINMMLTNNVPDALNTYFVSDPAGSCGYNLPYAGVAIAHGCSFDQDHTWAHEVGHALSLPHTFLGWENKVYNFNQPTPTTLTYDYTYFHDTLDTQLPVPLDTALVEKLDESNCADAADLFCDTPADYLSYRWACDGQGNSITKQRDPNGQEFYSDGTLFMSYAADFCQNRFSNAQIAAMRANLQSEKANWLHPGSPPPAITDGPMLLHPINNITVSNIGLELHWAAVVGATHYIVEVSRSASFDLSEFELISTNTSIPLPPLVINEDYYWRVKPFSFWNFCTSNSETGTFMTGAITATTSPNDNGWRCYPTLLQSGEEITVETPNSWLHHPAHYALYDLTGRLCWETAGLVNQGKFHLTLPPALFNGMYYLVAHGIDAVKTERLIVGNIH